MKNLLHMGAMITLAVAGVTALFVGQLFLAVLLSIAFVMNAVEFFEIRRVFTPIEF